MMKKQKSLFVFMLVITMLLLIFTACETVQNSKASKSITIAYQPSVGYAPLIVMKEQKQIEKRYNGEIMVNWAEMSSGSAITEEMISGNIDVGSMGVPVAVTGIQAGAPFRIAFALSAQPYAIQTNSKDIHTLSMREKTEDNL